MSLAFSFPWSSQWENILLYQHFATSPLSSLLFHQSFASCQIFSFYLFSEVWKHKLKPILWICKLNWRRRIKCIKDDHHRGFTLKESTPGACSRKLMLTSPSCLLDRAMECSNVISAVYYSAVVEWWITACIAIIRPAVLKLIAYTYIS